MQCPYFPPLIEVKDETPPVTEEKFNRILSSVKPENFKFPAYMNRKARRDFKKKFRRLK